MTPAKNRRRKIILLHGWTMNGAIFDRLTHRLPARFECIAPDLPGHATAAHLEPTLDACSDVVAQLLENPTQPRPLLVGWSMGAAAAWRYIARNGTANIAGLVTVDMSPKIVSGPDWPHGLLGQSADDVAASTRHFANDWHRATGGIAATMFASSAGVAGFDWQAARDLALSHNPDAMRALWQDMVQMDAREVIAKIDLPYLVCSGAQSRIYPASASDWLAQTAPDTQRHVFTASGHSPHLEEPDAFAKTIADFTDNLAD